MSLVVVAFASSVGDDCPCVFFGGGGGTLLHLVVVLVFTFGPAFVGAASPDPIWWWSRDVVALPPFVGLMWPRSIYKWWWLLPSFPQVVVVYGCRRAPLVGGCGGCCPLPVLLVVMMIALAPFGGGCCLSSLCWLDVSLHPLWVVVVVVTTPHDTHHPHTTVAILAQGSRVVYLARWLLVLFSLMSCVVGVFFRGPLSGNGCLIRAWLRSCRQLPVRYSAR